MKQHKKQYIEQHKNVIGTVRAVPRLGELYPGICLATEEKAWKTLSQGSCTSSVCLLVRVIMGDKNKDAVCCLLATSTVMLSKKKKRKRKM
jgi:hypothetical protein